MFLVFYTDGDKEFKKMKLSSWKTHRGVCHQIRYYSVEFVSILCQKIHFIATHSHIFHHYLFNRIPN